MQTRGVLVDYRAVNTAMSACAKAQQWSMVLKLYDQVSSWMREWEGEIKCMSVSVSVCGIESVCVCVYMSSLLPSPALLQLPLLLPPPSLPSLLPLPPNTPSSPPLNSNLCTLRCPPWQVTHSSPISSLTSRPCKQPAKRKMPPKQKRLELVFLLYVTCCFYKSSLLCFYVYVLFVYLFQFSMHR